MFKITVKNYRGFPDHKPMILEVRDGFTALVGTNNSGKSSILKFFHEFRNLFESLSTTPRPGPLSFRTSHVEDWVEIFHNQNDRDLTIEFLNTESVVGEMQKMQIRLIRDRPPTAYVDLFLQINTVGGVVKAESFHGSYNFIVNNQPIHGNWTKFSNFFQTIIHAFYVGPFRNAISEGAGTYYDIAVGTSFIAQWDVWKTGNSRQQSEAALKVADDIAHIFDFRRFEINAAYDKKSLQVVINGKPHKLNELGAGLAQFIIVFGNVATRRPTYLLIDEPELNLHPSLQIDFLTSLASYTTRGVIFASHSVGLARAVGDCIYTFRKEEDAVVVKPFEQTPNYAEFLGEMSFSSFKEIGCDQVLLVEGVTEVKAIQQFLRHLRMDHRIVLLPLGGSQLIRGGVQQELHELTRISNNVAVLIDSERESQGAELAADRRAFISDCQALGFKTHVTELRAFENYLCDRAIKAEKGNSYQALSSYGNDLKWAKSDNWRIARHMTNDEVLVTDIGKFLQTLTS